MKFIAATTSTLVQQCLHFEQAGPPPADRSTATDPLICLQVLLSQMDIFYQEHTFTQSLSSLLQSVWLPEAMQAAAACCRKWLCGQQDLLLSFRPCHEHMALVEEWWFGLTQDKWQWAVPAKNPVVSMPVECEHLGQNPTTSICLLHVPLLFHGEWAYFLY